MDAEGRALPNEGFCAPMGVCFGGVIGGLSPYASLSSSSASTKSSSDPSVVSSGPRKLLYDDIDNSQRQLEC